MNSISTSIQLTVFVETLYPESVAAEINNINAIDWNFWFQNWLEFLALQIAGNNACGRHKPPKQRLSPQTPSKKAGDAFASRIRGTRPYELSLRLTDDGEIKTFNRQYRQQDCSTDVLAFAALEANIPQVSELNEPLYLGDIIISLDTALEQARSQNHSLTIELAWLASHGLLHLLGWDHPDEDSLAKMLACQRNLLSQIGLQFVQSEKK